MATITLTKADLAEAQRLLQHYAGLDHKEIWTPLGLDGKKWSPEESVIAHSPIIRITLAHPEAIDKICCDVYFLPEYGALFDLGDTYSTKALIECLDSLGYGLDKINAVFLTHMHSDHFGNPALLKALLRRRSNAIPVLLSRQELAAYKASPLDALEASFRWMRKGDTDDFGVGIQALLVGDPSVYANQLSALEDGVNVNGLVCREKNLDTLFARPFAKDELRYAVFDKHHQAGDTIYVVGRCIILGDVFASLIGPLGNSNQNEYLDKITEIKRVVVSQGMSKGFVLCRGHSTEFNENKDVTLSGHISVYDD